MTNPNSQHPTAEDNDPHAHLRRPHNAAGRFERSIETAERDRDAADLRAEGRTYQQIADELGFAHRTDARNAVRRALRDIVKGPTEKLVTLEATRLETMYEEVLAILERDHVVVSHGKIVRDDDGNPIPDDDIKLRAIDRLLRTRESFRKLTGLDAPTKVEAQFTEVTQQDIELQEMVAEMRAKNAATIEALRAQREQGT